MRRLIALGLVAGCLAVLLTACSNGSGRDIRDGEARFPDDEGVVTAITTASITLDDARTYDVSKRLLAFNTYTRELEPMLGRAGQYVQIGLDGDTMIWMAGIGAVVEALDPPSAFYNGELAEITDHQGARVAVFHDGTVLRLSAGVGAVEPGTQVQARIDVATHEVIDLGGVLRGGAPDADTPVESTP